VILTNVVIVVAAYFVGAIPTGFIISKLHGIRDITKHGSGNIGATNVGRKLGTYGFLIVFLIDSLKAFSYLKILHIFNVSETIQILSAIALLIGNGYSVFLQFKGGKGVATCVGILLALAPYFFLMIFLLWLLVFLCIKTVGVASVITFVSLPIVSLLIFWGNWQFIGLMLFISLWGIYRHGNNIRRFLK